jgi:hypothetical protein
MRLSEFTDPNDYILPDAVAADCIKQITNVGPDDITDDTLRRLMKTVEIKKPRLLDTH